MKDSVITIQAALGATVVLRNTADQDLLILKPGELVVAVKDEEIRKGGWVHKSEVGDLVKAPPPKEELKWSKSGQVHIFKFSDVASVAVDSKVVVYVGVCPPNAKNVTYACKVAFCDPESQSRNRIFTICRTKTIEEGKRRLADFLADLAEIMPGRPE